LMARKTHQQPPSTSAALPFTPLRYTLQVTGCLQVADAGISTSGPFSQAL
jgi:hypothetical protein